MKRTLSQIVSDQCEREKLAARFWPKIDIRGPEECWPWKERAVTSFGYGRLTAGRGTHLKAHRVAAALTKDAFPDEAHILHSCDNPPCCNPSHLFVGDHLTNVADMGNKGRGSAPPAHFGAKHHNAKFDEATARSVLNDKRRARVIAAELGCCEETIRRIRNGQSWKLLPRS